MLELFKFYWTKFCIALFSFLYSHFNIIKVYTPDENSEFELIENIELKNKNRGVFRFEFYRAKNSYYFYFLGRIRKKDLYVYKLYTKVYKEDVDSKDDFIPIGDNITTVLIPGTLFNLKDEEFTLKVLVNIYFSYVKECMIKKLEEEVSKKN